MTPDAIVAISMIVAAPISTIVLIVTDPANKTTAEINPLRRSKKG